MKILYGVQGTGNGHITRARMMAEAFKKHSVMVDYLFSGKDDSYFNMEPFGNYRTLAGLSFVAEQGKVQYIKTLKRNNIPQFIDDVKTLELSSYDLVINDFEPVSAWAAKLNKIPCIGLSHQNIFRYQVPVRGQNPLASLVLKWFAPADQNLALHWHHFNQQILPPMINVDLKLKLANQSKILVYLPFMKINEYDDLFHRFPGYQFVQYHSVKEASVRGNVSCEPLSRKNFLSDFSDCSGIICSAGFGACSEAIHYGKKLMVIPLQGQMEQLSNAAALEQLGYAEVCETLKRKKLKKWLKKENPERVIYPDVANEVVHWMVNGRQETPDQLSEKLWANVLTNGQPEQLSSSLSKIPG